MSARAGRLAGAYQSTEVRKKKSSHYRKEKSLDCFEGIAIREIFFLSLFLVQMTGLSLKKGILCCIKPNGEQQLVTFTQFKTINTLADTSQGLKGGGGLRAPE